MNIFNIKIEFDHDAFRQAIEKCAADKDKGYVCVVDGNVLTMAQKDEAYRNIILNAYVNTCDGSSIATMCNKIYGTQYTAFTGPEIFAEYIEKSQFKQLLLGNTEEKYNQIKEKLEKEGKACSHISYMPVPFAKIDEFDYEGIARQINEIKPDFIWVSLGAPKQENFCSRLLPFIDSGLLFGIGAAFNFYVGDIEQPKFHIGTLRFTWLDRIFKEPKKQINRVKMMLRSYPALYKEEKRKAKQS